MKREQSLELMLDGLKALFEEQEIIIHNLKYPGCIIEESVEQHKSGLIRP